MMARVYRVCLVVWLVGVQQGQLSAAATKDSKVANREDDIHVRLITAPNTVHITSREDLLRYIPETILKKLRYYHSLPTQEKKKKFRTQEKLDDKIFKAWITAKKLDVTPDEYYRSQGLYRPLPLAATVLLKFLILPEINPQEFRITKEDPFGLAKIMQGSYNEWTYIIFLIREAMAYECLKNMQQANPIDQCIRKIQDEGDTIRYHMSMEKTGKELVRIAADCWLVTTNITQVPYKERGIIGVFPQDPMVEIKFNGCNERVKANMKKAAQTYVAQLQQSAQALEKLAWGLATTFEFPLDNSFVSASSETSPNHSSAASSAPVSARDRVTNSNDARDFSDVAKDDVE